MPDNQLKKKGRGSYDFRTDTDNNIIICKWWDNKGVLCASNYIGIEPLDTCNRFDRKNKVKLTPSRPAIIKEYNEHMGRVDKADMLLSLYKTKNRTKKW